MHKFACPGCGHVVKYKDEHVGKKARCPKCGDSIRLPAPGTEVVAAKSSPPLLPANAKVTFICPRCRQPAGVPTLKSAASEPKAPTTVTGALLGFLTSTLAGKPVIDAGTVPVQCPRCSATFPCREVEGLTGELLVACPHCRHTSLHSPLAASAVLTCDSCRKGFTAGIVTDIKGTLVEGPTASVAAPPLAAPSLLLRYRCVQTTHTFEFGSGKNEAAQYELKRDHSICVADPEAGISKVEQPCPCCQATLAFTMKSVTEAARSADTTRRVAGVTAWALAAVPLAAAWFAARYFLGAYVDDIPPLDIGAGFATVLLAIIGLVSLYMRSDGYRRQALLPEGRVTLATAVTDHSLWRESGMYTKGARLEVAHHLLAIESPDAA